ncbi:MAG: Asd/ArgC dimerization domain-containing protein [Candidatus Poseidoniaceae archaeon]|nr:Asd/ArgC dimerization domain-containing protein [Candidatus Poseidoniaceae archaeon]
MKKFSVAILGANGLVGQRLQQRLYDHPMFELSAIAGSPSSVGLMHSELDWKIDGFKPNYDILICSMSDIPDVDIVFSALPSQIAAVVEPSLVARGIHVFSNSSKFRRVAGIPLVIPEINPEMLRTYDGHACATNCTVVPIITPLKGLLPLGIQSISVHTRQALSGGGWRMMTDSAALSGDLDPIIVGEEEKVCAELKHILNLDIPVNATCNRVPHKDGHKVSVEVKLSKNTTLSEVKELFNIQGVSCPSSPETVNIVIESTPTRKEHLWLGGEGLAAGMATVVGNIRVNERTVRYDALSHNTVRGAAGGVILLAEFAVRQSHITK